MTDGFILNILFPKRCLGCQKIGKYICSSCTLLIRIIEQNEAICPVCEKLSLGGVTHPGCRGRYALDGLTSFFRYNGIIRNIIKKIKYKYIFDLAEEVGNLIPLTSYNILRNKFNGNNSIVIPIPLHILRFRERGFNQAEIFSEIISTKLQISLENKLLIRTKSTIPQAELKTRKDRLKNIRGIFKVNNNQAIQRFNNHVCILVDDVYTTGATMRDAATTLKKAGVKFVWGVTIAR